MHHPALFYIVEIEHFTLSSAEHYVPLSLTTFMCKLRIMKYDYLRRERNVNIYTESLSYTSMHFIIFKNIEFLGDI